MRRRIDAGALTDRTIEETLPEILITNDDGIHSEGLRALQQSLSEVGHVTVVAPDREMSAVSQSITLHAPLRYTPVKEDEFVVEGTPSDCIIVALNSILKEPPDLVVSGINKGANLGDDIMYSGTVAGALEATFNGIPAFAISLAARSDFHFEPAASFAARMAEHILEHGLPEDVTLNINCPKDWLGGVRFTRQGRKRNRNVLLEHRDPRGRKYFWVHEEKNSFFHSDGTDFAAIEAGAISVTPLRLDRTDYEALKQLQTWAEDLESRLKAESTR